MCELNAILKKSETERETLMEGVSHVTLDAAEKIVLETILGEQTIVDGVIREIDVTTNQLIIVPR